MDVGDRGSDAGRPNCMTVGTALDTLLSELIDAVDLVIRSLDDAVAGIEDIKQALVTYRDAEPLPPDPEPEPLPEGDMHEDLKNPPPERTAQELTALRT